MSDDLDEALLERELDRAKADIFTHSDAAFLAPLMCSMSFHWDRDIPTAATNGHSVWFNPDWFLRMPRECRGTELLHEMWHPARGHMLRGIGRDQKLWNIACDIVINNGLDEQNRKFDETVPPWRGKQWIGKSEEEIYEELKKDASKRPEGDRYGPDGEFKPITEADIQKSLNNLVKAAHAAEMAGQPGAVPGSAKLIINKFLAPKIPWQSVFQEFFTDLIDEDFSWHTPNRRYTEMYLPSRYTDEGRLKHIVFFEDVSGSVKKRDLLRYNSEVKYIWEVFQPEKLTIVLFDTMIQRVIELTNGQQFDDIEILGRGGTHFGCVRQWIMDNKPSAAAIFSDMYATPMEPGPECPIIWIGVNTQVKEVPFGKFIKIRD